MKPGDRIGPYRIVAELGAGGMGEVYRAHDTRLNRDVAVKVLPGSVAADESHLQRFMREAQSAGSLNHPNILAVFDVGDQDGVRYLVTELLEGKTLRERLVDGPLPLSKAVELARQVTSGLAAAHAKGIVHRDIKPANLFVTTDGRLKILDFGLARQEIPEDSDVTRGNTLTEAGAMLGTVGYMAPEQVRGRPADARSDIFAVGVVLYEMLEGRRAFSGGSAVETLHAILQSDPPELSGATLAAAPAVGRILSRCLQKEPAERFQSAHDLGLALEAIAGGSGASVAERAPSVRRFGPILPMAGLAIAVVAAVAGAYVERHLTAVPSTLPPSIESVTYSGHDRSPAASPDGKTIAFSSDRDGVSRIWLKQVVGGGELALTSGPDDAPRFSPDGSAILFVRSSAEGTALYRVSPLGGETRRLLDDVSGADWSPDGRRLAFTRWVSGDRSGSIVGVADADGSDSREVAFVEGRALITPRWSPDGRTIAAVNGLASVASAFGIDLVDSSGAGVRHLDSPKVEMRLSSVVWSADGRAVLYSEAESMPAWMSGSSARIVRQDVATGKARPVLWVPNHSEVLDVLGPGLLLFDTRSSRENLREIPLGADAGDARWLTRGDSNDRQPTYSPDGRWVTFASNRAGNMDLWAVDRTDGATRRLTDADADDWDPAYSADGKRLLWGSNRTGAFEIWSANPDGSEPHQLTHAGAFAQNPQETPDGEWIVYANTTSAPPGLWRMRADGSEPQCLVEGPRQNPELSPDGRYVLYVDGLVGRVRVARVADGATVPFELVVTGTRNTPTILGRSRWMPDGKAIAFIGQDERGVNGVFVQDFVPGRDTSATRRPLGGFDPESSAESFGISPDGRAMTVASWEQRFNIMVVRGVPGLKRGA